MSTTKAPTHPASKVTDIVVIDAGNESSASGDNTKGQTSRDGLQFQEEIPYVDEDWDAGGEDVCETADRRPREQLVTRIPAKVELKTLTHMAKRPAVDIEFQDLTYSVRNPGRRTGKVQQAIILFLYYLIGLY
jgi:hypothetical protein